MDLRFRARHCSYELMTQDFALEHNRGPFYVMILPCRASK